MQRTTIVKLHVSDEKRLCKPSSQVEPGPARQCTGPPNGGAVWYRSRYAYRRPVISVVRLRGVQLR
jgi:hypothetical protein